jgi:hypothetical protein
MFSTRDLQSVAIFFIFSNFHQKINSFSSSIANGTTFFFSKCFPLVIFNQLQSFSSSVIFIKK